MMIVRTTARDARVHLKPADVLFTLNTLGAPEWTLEDVARNARAWGYAGVDLRLLDGELITTSLVRENMPRLRSLFPPSELPLTVLATSVRLSNADPDARQRARDEAHAWIDLAGELGVPVVRVFGGDPRAEHPLQVDDSIAVVAESLASLAEHAEQARVQVGLETHDEFSSASAVARAITGVPGPWIGAIWDMFHTARMGESPTEVLSALADRLVNVHLKDGRRENGGWRLVLLGDGEIAVRDALKQLQARGYAGCVSVEWEKKWHPELAEPEVAFPQHMRVLRAYLADAG